MSRKKDPLLRRGCDREKGQALYLVAGLVFFLLAAAAFVVDFGRVVHAQLELQASADAAATAGAQGLPNGALAVSNATQYSAVTGNNNASSDLPNVTMVSGYPMLKCLTTLVQNDQACIAPAAANAIQVKEQVSVPMFFAKVFGINSVQLTATATASMRGGTPHPLNVIIIVDTTTSMLSADPNCPIPGIANPTKLDCAKAGVRTLLKQLWPCSPSLANCGSASSGNVANPVDEVALMTFPGLGSSTNALYEYTGCQATNIKPYIVPYSATTIYTIVPFSSDYRVSDTSGLNGAVSHLVQSVDWADGVGCTPTGSGSGGYGLQATGPPGTLTYHTYYAGAIAAAQAAFPTSGSRGQIQDVIIILSDGDANSTASWVIDPTLTSNECHQGIAAAQAAAAAGTWVYSIAYGANTTSPPDCRTDTTPISGCAAMRAMASSPGNYPDPSKFYAEYASAALGCSSAVHPSLTSLNQIFQSIGNDLLTTALIPNNTP